jgi:hypothetical protein
MPLLRTPVYVLSRRFCGADFQTEPSKPIIANPENGPNAQKNARSA